MKKKTSKTYKCGGKVKKMKTGGAVSSNPKKEVWNSKNPKPKSERKKLTPAQKTSAKASASKAGRKYPNLVDNMRAAKSGKSKRK